VFYLKIILLQALNPPSNVSFRAAETE